MQENINPVGYSTTIIKKVNDKLTLDIKENSPLRDVQII